MIDEKKLRLIAAIVIMFIGAAYMTWLVLTYLKSVKLEDHVRTSFDKWLAGQSMTKVVPGDVAKDDGN